MTNNIIHVPHEIVLMIEFRRAAFEYAVIANLIEDNDFPKETLVQYLREQSERFTKAHDDIQSSYARKNAEKASKETPESNQTRP